MKKNNILLLLFSSMLLFSACGPKTMEEQVENLIKSTDLLERKEIAYALADSLSTHPIELLMGLNASHFNEQHIVVESIEYMLTRYSNYWHLPKMSEPSARSYDNSIMTCVRFVADPTAQRDRILDQQKIDFIIHGLLIKNSDSNYQKALAMSAKEHGKSAMVRIIKEWNQHKDSKELLYAISYFQDEAINYLSAKIVDDKDAVELLAQIGEPAVNTMIAKMKHGKQSVRFAAGDVLVKMIKHHPGAVVRLTSAINNNGVRLIAKNYPFYIRLGQANTEKLLLKALRQNFSTEMCVDYLNCGNAELESGATDIASDNGYMVTPSFGGNDGPRWGSGN